MPLVGFLPPNDEVRSTLDVIMQKLMVDGLVRRYDTAAGVDGFQPEKEFSLPAAFGLWII